MWYVAELPGAIPRANAEEVRENLSEAIQLILEPTARRVSHETIVHRQHLSRRRMYIAQCVQVDVASQGATEMRPSIICVTLSNCTSPRGATIMPHVRDIEVDIKPMKRCPSAKSTRRL